MTENLPQKCLTLCGLFEGELLLELMLRHWNHPLADNSDFRSQVIESASEVLATAATPSCTDVFVKGLPTHEMNFVAAIWYLEFCAASDEIEFQEERQRWLRDIRRALPSCFVSTDFLQP